MTRVNPLHVLVSTFTAIAMLTAVQATPASAMGGGGSSGSSGSSGTRSLGTTLNCPDGWEVSIDPQTNQPICVRKTSQLPGPLPVADWRGADPDFVDAAVLVHSGAFPEAIAAFKAKKCSPLTISNTRAQVLIRRCR